MPHCAENCGGQAPDSLRPDGRAKRHLVDLAQPDHAPVGGQLVAGPDVIMPGLPSDRSVIALWEVDEMTRTPLPRTARAYQASSIISETCPPGEGDLFCVKADAMPLPLACRAASYHLSPTYTSAHAPCCAAITC